MARYPSKVSGPAQLSNKVRMTQEQREELKEKILKWKKQAWFDFCKLLMEQDKRYTLLPMMDYNARTGANSMVNRVQNAEGVFSNFCLTRAGDMADIFIVPCDPMLGIMIDAGSKYSKLTLQGFPSKTMVWPIVRIADELERQYTREVSIESNKHGNSIGRPDAKRTSSTDSDSHVDQLSADSQAD